MSAESEASEEGAAKAASEEPAASAGAVAPAPAVAPSKRAAWIRNAMRLVGPVLLVVVFARMKERQAVFDLLKSAFGWELFAALALNVAAVHVKVVRWGVLLAARGIHYPTRRMWSAFLASSYVGMLTPGRVGDVLRVQYLRYDQNIPYPVGLASIVVDRLCDLYVLAAFVGLAIVRFRSVFAGELAYLTWITMALTILGPLLFFVPGVAEAVAGRLYAKMAKGPGAEGGFSLFLQAMRASVGRGLWKAIPLTVLAFLIAFLQGYLLARGLGMQIAYYDVGCLLAIASLLGLLPISISGLGVRELIYALVFPLLGYTAANGVGFGLLVFAVLYLAIVVMGFVGWQIAPPPVGLPPRGEGVPLPVGKTGT